MKEEVNGKIPLNLTLLWFLTGPCIALPYLSFRMPKKSLFLLIGLSVIPFVALFLWSWNATYFSLAFLLYNGMSLKWFSVVGRASRIRVPSVTWAERLKNGGALFVVGLPISFVVVGAERWISDALMSSLMQVNFSIDSIKVDYFTGVGKFSVLVICLSIFLGQYKLKWSLEKRVLVLVLAGGISILFEQLQNILLLAPEQQIVMANLYPSWVATMRSSLFLFIYVFFTSVLIQEVLFSPSVSKALGVFVRGSLSLVMMLIGTSLISGMSPYYMMLAARQYEKYGYVESARYWYSHTFHWVQSEELKSYLAFHIGLLAKKNNENQAAKEMFSNVTSRYSALPDLAEKARIFRDNLISLEDKEYKRVVIPGVEARTEYKSAYCVPNSLGLVLNYWGDKVGAKSIGEQITNLEAGSFITDEAFFTESRGLSHTVIPFAKREEVKRLIDQGIPVLAFIPGHVLAIFGYDEALETFVTYDVATHDIWDERSWSEFDEQWNKSHNLIAVVLPLEKSSLVENIFGKEVRGISEDYLQYLIYTLANKSSEEKLNNLENIHHNKVFFAHWEYNQLTGNVLNHIKSDSLPQAYLLKYGVEEAVILKYLFSLINQEKYREVVGFLQKYQGYYSLSNALINILAGAWLKLKEDEKAIRLLVSHQQFPQYESYIIEYLLKNKVVRSRSHLALPLSIQLLSQSAFALNEGSSAQLAYEVWSQNHSQSSNAMESLKFIYEYLMNWNRFDVVAIKEMREAFERVKFNTVNSEERKKWLRRVVTFEANLMKHRS